MPVSPAAFYGPTLFQAPGFLRIGLINGIPVMVDNYDANLADAFQYQRWAVPIPEGLKQKTMHSRGTAECDFTVGGDATVEGATLALFLDPVNRGITFPVAIQQGGTVDYLAPCMFSMFELRGTADEAIQFRMTGKCLSVPAAGTPFVLAGVPHPIPAWATGNALMESWSIQHTVQLTPVWGNTQDPFPRYYRTGESEYVFTTASTFLLQEYDTLSIGIGSVTITGLVQRRTIVSNGRNVRTYPVEVTNVALTTSPRTASVQVLVNAIPLFDGYPDGLGLGVI